MKKRVKKVAEKKKKGANFFPPTTINYTTLVHTPTPPFHLATSRDACTRVRPPGENITRSPSQNPHGTWNTAQSTAI